MKNLYYSVLLFLIFFLIYFMGSFSKIPFGDGVGFILFVEKGEYMKTATATGHILYINTAILLKNIFSINAIEASKLLIISSAAATISVIFLSIKSLVNKDWIAIMGSIIFGFSFSFWKNAEIVEVYTYNSLYLSLFYFCIIKSFTTKKEKYIVLSGFFLGISLWVHIQNILLIPAFILFLFNFRNNKKSCCVSVIIFSLFFISLFALNYTQGLPLNSPYSSDQGTWVEDSLKKSFIQYIQDLAKSVIYLFYNFNVFTFFGLIGMILFYRQNRKMFMVFFTAAFLVYGFSTFYAVSDNYVFFIPFNIIFALSIGYGLSSTKYSFVKKISWVCLLIPMTYYFAYKIVLSTEKGKEFSDFKCYKGGLQYYMFPWMNNNIGIMEFTLDHGTAPEPVNWVTESSEEYIRFLKSKGYTDQQIRNL